MDNLYNLRSVLAKAMRLPVMLFRTGRLAAPEAADIPSAQRLARGAAPEAELAPDEGQPGSAQYLANRFDEHFVYLGLGAGDALWLGPVLTAAVPEGRVSQLIRRERLAIRSKLPLMEHYASLPVLSEDELYQVGKLAESLLAKSAAREEASAGLWPAQPAAESGLARLRGNMDADDGKRSPYFMELEMIRLVTTGDLEGALSMMMRINDFSRAILAQEPTRSLKNSLICNCTFLARAAIAGGVSPEDAFNLSDRLIREVERTRSIAELEEHEKQNLMRFVELVHSYNVSNFSKSVREVMGYVNAHLGEKMALPTLAALVYLHPNYLSTLFRRECGLPLSLYIQRQRIEESKLMIRYTDNPISEIASFYQFSSQSHFISRFRAATGMTPLQYRNHSEGHVPRQGAR